jgi:hypothetical protein
MLSANTELSFASRKRTQNTFVDFVVRRSTPTRMKVADNEQATMGVLAKSRTFAVHSAKLQSRSAPDRIASRIGRLRLGPVGGVHDWRHKRKD